MIAHRAATFAGSSPTADGVRATARALREGAAELRACEPAARIAALERVAAGWLAEDSPWRRRALDEVPAATGYPRAAVAIALANLWSALRAPQLADTIHSEGLDLAVHRPNAPRLAVHVLAGNVPGAGFFGIVAALLAGVPSLVKPAAREPHLPALLVDSIAALAPALSRAVAVVPWRGGSAELDAAAVAEADVMLAYGRDATLDALAARAPHRLLRFGPRASVALLARRAATRRTAAALAEQVALFDQQGCLSAQVACLEEASPEETRRFASLVAEELARLAHELPRAPLTLADAAAVSRYLERQRWRAQEGEPVEVEAGEHGVYSVVTDRAAAWVPSPLFRHLVLLPVTTMAAAAERLAPLAGLVEAVGYRGPSARLGEAAAVADASGAHRLCPLERMQAPPFGWRQSGHARMRSLLEPIHQRVSLATFE